MDKPVYLDWAATAPLCKEAADAMAVRRSAHSNRRAKI